MRILILTQYYPPEIGAPQNRLRALALHLKLMGAQIEVLTAMPNYPQMKIHEGYENKKYLREEIDGIVVHRSSIYVTKKRSVVARLRNYFSFVLSSARTGSKLQGAFDFLFCESPPLFLGYSALYLTRKLKCRLIFNVSDLWPESAEKMGVVKNVFLLRRAYALEARLYHRSALITGQTQGICTNIKTRFPGVQTYWLPNGADLDLFDPAVAESKGWRKSLGFDSNDLVFLYAGIIGLAQGLDVILRSAKKFEGRHEIKFVLMGSGPELHKLQTMKDQHGLKNVFFAAPVPRTEMPSILKEVYATIVPLRKLDLFKGAIPSKLFESLAMGVPVLLGVDGEARNLFIEEGKCGLYFEPENENELGRVVEELVRDVSLRHLLGESGKTYIRNRFDRKIIAEGLLDRLKSLL